MNLDSCQHAYVCHLNCYQATGINLLLASALFTPKWSVCLLVLPDAIAFIVHFALLAGGALRGVAIRSPLTGHIALSSFNVHYNKSASLLKLSRRTHLGDTPRAKVLVK